MPRARSSYVLTPDAADDLDLIADFTIQNFGVEQARRYRDGLKRAFEFIAADPYGGRDQSHIRPGYRRHPHGSHGIFYLIKDDHVLIARVLHGAQDPLRHLGEN
jgi:toxin ParE1/3/4